MRIAENTTPPQTPLQKKLSRMVGQTYLHNSFYKQVLSFAVSDQHVYIQTNRNKVVLPSKGAAHRLEQEFLPL